MSSLKDLFISIKVKPKGTEKLKEFNETIKTTLSLMKDFKRVNGINTSENKLVQTEKEVTEKTKKNKKGFLNIAPNIASVVYLTKALTNLIGRVGQLSYELLKLNRNFGVSTNMLQNLGYEAVANGVKMEDFNSAIATLKKNSADIMLGRGNISPYALLGLNPHEDPEKMLISLQKRLRELPESIGTAFASDLGLSMDMINYIRKADFSRKAPLLSNAELKTLEKARNLILDFKNTLSILVQKISISLAPLVNNVFGGINDWIKSAILGTEQLSSTIIASLTAVGVFLTTKFPMFSAIVGGFLVIEDIIKNGGEGIKLWAEYLLVNVMDALKNLGKYLMENTFIGKFFDWIMPSKETVDKVSKALTDWNVHAFRPFRQLLGMYPESDIDNYVQSLDFLKAKSQLVDIQLAGEVQLKNEKGETVGVARVGENGDVYVVGTSMAGEGAR